MIRRKKNLTNNDRISIRAESTRVVLQKTNRILGSQANKVVITDSSVSAPAYTDGKTVYINSSFDPLKTSLNKGFTRKSMLITTALNYHELAHTLFMPRLDSHFVDRVKSGSAFQTFNILQDAADETKFVALYEPAKNYFTAAVSEYLINSNFGPAGISQNYILVSGRKFMPWSLRKKLRDSFFDQSIVDEMDRLIAKYKYLSYPSEQDEMFLTLVELHRLISRKGITVSVPSHDGVLKGSPNKERNEEATAQAEEMDLEIEEKDLESEEEEQSEDLRSGLHGEQDEKGQEEEDSSGEDQGQSGDFASSEEGSESQDPSRPSRGSSKEEVEQDLKDAIEDAIEDAKEEIEERISSITDEESNYRSSLDEVQPVGVESPLELIPIARKCADEFREVRDRNAPGWHTYQRTGKLDHRRYASALGGSDYVYRRWYEGVNDATDFEVVFMIDLSYSMAGHAVEDASKALWTLHRAFDELNGSITVISFSNTTKLISQRGKRAPDKANIYGVFGGTVVTPALEEANRILSVSKKPIRFGVVITDGQFGDSAEASDFLRTTVESFAVVGIRVDVSYLGNMPSVIYTKTIESPTELVEVVKQIALRLSDEYTRR